MQYDTGEQIQNEQLSNNQNWWAKIVALIAVANLLLVLFNFSYIPLRDIYLHKVPSIVRLYDPIKNIEPNPETTTYLNTVDSLKKQIATGGIESPLTQQTLEQLRQQSSDLLAENPFAVANQFGTFAQLKRRMEYQMKTNSAKQAFSQFWSNDYLSQTTPELAFTFFDRKIKPLLEVNYYREIDEYGQFIDQFSLIDLAFSLFFALELLIRSFFISIKQEGVSWGDTILRRWYEVFLILPFWRWLRIIPVTVKLHRSGLISLTSIIAQITHEPAAYLADRTSVFILVRLINQAIEAVETGALARSLLEPSEGYIQVNEINKLDAITDRILALSIYKVLPEVQPDVETLLRHSLTESLQQSDLIRGLPKIPGLDLLPTEATEQLAQYLAKSVYTILLNSYSDIEGRELFENLAQNFKKSLTIELGNQETQSELQTLLSQMLEEFKLNYVQNSQKYDPTQTLNETQKIEQTINQENDDNSIFSDRLSTKDKSVATVPLGKKSSNTISKNE